MILGIGLKEHVRQINNQYLNSKNEIQAVLTFSDVAIMDKILNGLDLTEAAAALENVTLALYDKVWKTIHYSWDKEFISLFVTELRNTPERNIPFIHILNNIFSLNDENVVFSVLMFLM